MITSVDTSVILDILSASPHYLEISKAAFKRCHSEGKMVINPVVWAEVRPFFDSNAQMEEVMTKMHLVFDDLNQEVASEAGLMWRVYRKAGGGRQRLISDFLIGAHVLLRADRLLTRDRGFYRTYFKNLTLVEP